jgi:hypothetical protein
MRGRRILGRERVHERVGELVGRQRDDAVPLRRMGKRWRSGLHRREGKDEDSLRRSRAHRDAGAPEATIEQELDDQAAEGVADQDGRLVEGPDLGLVVVDDLRQTKALELVRALALCLDARPLTWPLGRRDVVAPALELPGERLPAARCEPGSMDEHQRNPIGGGFHGETSRLV